MNFEQALQKLNLKLPNTTSPGGSYTSVNLRGNQAFVAIQFPIYNGAYCYQGRLVNEISTLSGTKAMELCALNILSQIQNKVGVDQVLGLNHIDAYYQAEDQWDDGPIIVDGASDLFIKLLEEKGVHSRSILGVHKLPRNFCVGLSASFTLNSQFN